MAIEIVPNHVIISVKADGYECTVRGADIRQNGVTYLDQVRRITLATPDGTIKHHETKGHNCESKALSWITLQTEGSITDL